MNRLAKHSAAFGAQVRARRQALRLTQSQLGQRIGAAAITIRKIEAGDRRASYQMARLLADALRVPAAERAAFLSSVDEAADDPQQLLTDDAGRAIPLHGRLFERDTLLALLSKPDTALVTLTGVGGVGKSALARIVFDALCARDDMRVAPLAFVDVSAFADANQVFQKVAQLLSIPSRFEDRAPLVTRVAHWIGDRTCLLVLDGFESIKKDTHVLLGLLTKCARLRLLVTSQVRLRQSNEHVYSLGPLAIDDAVAFFRARAERADPKFEWQEADTAAARVICDRLDGLPLALELVAARSALMTPVQLMHRLLPDQDKLNLNFVADGISKLPGRHRSLLRTLNWSYALLSPLAQRALRRLAVFAGEFSIECAEAVLAQPDMPAHGVSASGAEPADDDAFGTTWNALTLLLDASLLHRRATPSPRFCMLNTVRAYAHDRCVEAAELDDAERCYLAWALDFARQQAKRTGSAETSSALAAIDSEKHLLIRAIDMAHARGEHDTALRLCVALGDYWHESSSFAEGRQHLLASLSQPVSDESERLAALTMAGHLAVHQADYAEANRLIGAAHSGYVALGDVQGQAATLFSLGWCHIDIPDPHAAARLFEASAACWRAVGDEKCTSDAELSLSLVLSSSGIDVPRAEALAQSALAVAHRCRDDALRVRALSRLTTLALNREDDDGAARCLSEADGLLVSIHDMGEHAWIHVAWGELHLLRNHEPQSRAAFERALAIWSQESHAQVLACAEVETQLALLALRRGAQDEARRLFEASEMTLAHCPLSIARLLNLAGLIELARTSMDLGTLRRLHQAVGAQLNQFAVRGHLLMRAAEQAQWRWLADRWAPQLATSATTDATMSVADIVRELHA
jgi:predicted ATPase/DNA-binding XRE family transcriptional regulator